MDWDVDAVLDQDEEDDDDGDGDGGFGDAACDDNDNVARKTIGMNGRVR